MAKLSKDQLQKTKKMFNRLNALDYSQIEYKLGTQGYSKNRIKRMKKEFLRFLAICVTQKGDHAPSFLVDEVWHQAILATQFYKELCAVCGQFVHHNGNDGTKKVADKNKKAYRNTVQVVHDTFGELDLDIWGIEPIPHLGVKQ